MKELLSRKRSRGQLGLLAVPVTTTAAGDLLLRPGARCGALLGEEAGFVGRTEGRVEAVELLEGGRTGAAERVDLGVGRCLHLEGTGLETT